MELLVAKPQKLATDMNGPFLLPFPPLWSNELVLIRKKAVIAIDGGFSDKGCLDLFLSTTRHGYFAVDACPSRQCCPVTVRPTMPPLYDIIERAFQLQFAIADNGIGWSLSARLDMTKYGFPTR